MVEAYRCSRAAEDRLGYPVSTVLPLGLSARWQPERSSAGALRPRSSSSHRCVEHRCSHRTSGSASGTPRFASPAWRSGATASTTFATCVSRLVAAGADIKLVQAVAGHANPLITLKRYSHLLDTPVTEAATRFDPAGISLS